MIGNTARYRLLPQAELILLILAMFGALPAAEAEEKSPPAPIRDSKHQFRRHVRNWQQLRRRNVVMQRRDFSCGAAALATLIRYYWGDQVTEDYYLKELDKLLTPEEARDRIENGLSLTDLRRVAVQTGYLAKLGKLPFSKLVESKVPLIVGMTVDGYDHFVVYRGWDGQWVYLADPIQGNVRVHTCKFPKQWQKNAILAVVKRGEKIKEVSALSVRADETFLGAMSWQYIRSRGVKFPTSPLPVRSIR